MRTRLLPYFVVAAAAALALAGCGNDQSATTAPTANGPVDPFGAPGAIQGGPSGVTSAASLTGNVVAVDPATLECAGVIDFNDVGVGNYDAIFESGGADFAERFVGQSLSFSGNFDVLSGTPTSPLTLQAGTAGQNLSVTNSACCATPVLAGLGPLGYPALDAIGEGSMAVLFDYDQSQFGFELVGGDGGSATLSFFRRDGSLVDQVVVTGLNTQAYGFARVGGVHDIAGISIENTDPGGIGLDNLCSDVPGVPGTPATFTLDVHPGSCPNPVNVKSQGVTPVAILGTTGGDVTEIDPSTILLEGVAPIRWKLADVGTPVIDGEECECNTLGGDGVMDLTLKFKTQDLISALGLVPGETSRTVTITGTLNDGTTFEASDCIVLRGLPKDQIR